MKYLLPKRYKSGDLPFVVEPSFCGEAERTLNCRLYKRWFLLVFYPNVFVDVRVYLLSLFIKEVSYETQIIVFIACCLLYGRIGL